MRTAAFGQAPVLLERPTKLCAAAPGRLAGRPGGLDADCRKPAGAVAGCPLAAQRRARVKGDCEVLLGALLSALQLRGIASKAPLTQVQLSALEDPLSEVAAIYRLTLERHRQLPGHAALSRMPSRRLFGGLLEPEARAAATFRPPDSVQQETDDLPALLEHACGAQALLQSAVAPNAAPDSWPAGQVIVRPEGVPSASFAFNPGPMSRDEAEAEAQVLFRPAAGKQACRHLLNIARLTLVFEGCEALQVGVAHLLRRLTVVAVLNLYPAPGRLGEQSVRMLVLTGGGGHDGAAPAHICELRLEELAWWQARGAARRHLDQFHTALRATHSDYSSGAAGIQALSCLVRSVLSLPPEGRSLRAFRCRLAKRYGSTVAAWRSAFGGDWNASFAAFQKHFQTVLPREEAAVRWMELDSSLANTVSLFELDPEAPVLLERLRRNIAAASTSYAEEAEWEAGDPSVERLFEMMPFECCRPPPARPQRLDGQEFRRAARALGLGPGDADRAFACLDSRRGGRITEAGHVSHLDFRWLKSLPQLVDLRPGAWGEELRLQAQQHDAAVRIQAMFRGRAARRKLVSSIYGVLDYEEHDVFDKAAPRTPTKRPAQAGRRPRTPSPGAEARRRFSYGLLDGHRGHLKAKEAQQKSAMRFQFQEMPAFIAASSFRGRKLGYKFQSGSKGVGYYRDEAQAADWGAGWASSPTRGAASPTRGAASPTRAASPPRGGRWGPEPPRAEEAEADPEISLHADLVRRSLYERIAEVLEAEERQRAMEAAVSIFEQQVSQWDPAPAVCASVGSSGAASASRRAQARSPRSPRPAWSPWPAGSARSPSSPRSPSPSPRRLKASGVREEAELAADAGTRRVSTKIHESVSKCEQGPSLDEKSRLESEVAVAETEFDASSRAATVIQAVQRGRMARRLAESLRQFKLKVQTTLAISKPKPKVRLHLHAGTSDDLGMVVEAGDKQNGQRMRGDEPGDEQNGQRMRGDEQAQRPLPSGGVVPGGDTGKKSQAHGKDVTRSSWKRTTTNLIMIQPIAKGGVVDLMAARQNNRPNFPQDALPKRGIAAATDFRREETNGFDEVSSASEDEMENIPTFTPCRRTQTRPSNTDADSGTDADDPDDDTGDVMW